MNRQSCALMTLGFVMVYSCVDRLFAKTEQQDRVLYAWSALKSSAEIDIKNGRARDAEHSVLNALEIAERDLTTNNSVDSGKAASLDQLCLADCAAVQAGYGQELDEVFSAHKLDDKCKPLMTAVMRKTLRLSSLSLSILKKYHKSDDRCVRDLELANSKFQALLIARQ